jgi:hypothetical protein
VPRPRGRPRSRAPRRGPRMARGWPAPPAWDRERASGRWIGIGNKVFPVTIRGPNDRASHPQSRRRRRDA